MGSKGVPALCEGVRVFAAVQAVASVFAEGGRVSGRTMKKVMGPFPRGGRVTSVWMDMTDSVDLSAVVVLLGASSWKGCQKPRVEEVREGFVENHHKRI